MATKSKKSALWFCRFDGEKEFLRSKLKELAGCIDVEELLGAYHLGDKKTNPHTHFVMKLKGEPQKQSVAVRLKKLFGLEQKNRDYAIDVWDGDHTKGATGYLFHESECEILVNKGFSDADIASARLANEAVQRVVEMNKEKASNRLVEKALEHFNGKDASRQDILIFFAKRIMEGENHYPGSFMLKRYVEEVELRQLNPSELTRWAWTLENNLWR